MKYLITFGCSWTWGAGSGYNKGMSLEEFKLVVFNKEISEKNSFRSILAKKYGYENINFSIWKSSNKKQFRLARQFFSSDAFAKIRENATEIIVLWGITSTARNEVFSNNNNEYLNFLLNNPHSQQGTEDKISNFFLENIYDHTHEIFELAHDMTHWNEYLKLLGIKNYWFDSFNHHDYTTHSTGRGTEYINNTKIENFAINHASARDLMSQLAIVTGMNNYDSNYHSSAWVLDTNRANFLIQNGLVNPFSFHPTKEGHTILAGMMEHLFEQ